MTDSTTTSRSSPSAFRHHRIRDGWPPMTSEWTNLLSSARRPRSSGRPTMSTRPPSSSVGLASRTADAGLRSVKSRGVVFRGDRVIFCSCQALRAGMSLVGTSSGAVAGSGTVVARARCGLRAQGSGGLRSTRRAARQGRLRRGGSGRRGSGRSRPRRCAGGSPGSAAPGRGRAGARCPPFRWVRFPDPRLRSRCYPRSRGARWSSRRWQALSCRSRPRSSSCCSRSSEWARRPLDARSVQ